MRPRTACSACRKRQRKCIAPHNTESPKCEFCVRNEFDCSLISLTPRLRVTRARTYRKHVASSTSPVNTSTSSDQTNYGSDSFSSLEIPPMEACIEIASAYFTYIHEPSHNVFHRPTFMSDLVCDMTPRSILLCVLAIAARFSKHSFFEGTQPRSRGNIYAREAERQLDLHTISLITLQTTLLLGAFYGAEGDSLHENLYYSMACRMASLLKLPDCCNSTPLNREIGIRLWWTLEMIDVWSSNSVQLPRLLLARIDIPLPSNEAEFLRLRRSHAFHETSAFTPQTREVESVLVQKIQLNSLLSDIADLNKASAAGTLTNYETHLATEELAQRLNSWYETLPDSLVNNPENLNAQAASGSGGAFVALHVGFYHFSQLLYYQYLHQSLMLELSSSPIFSEVHAYAERCRESSTALCELLYKAQIMPGTEVLYSMIGHVLVISSTVQLHIVLFSDEESDIDAARQRLEKNFLMLLNLQNLWRNIDHSFGRLKEFHAACLQAKTGSQNSSNTFRLNKWMTSFLMEFSNQVEQRTETGCQTPDGMLNYGRNSEEISELVQQELRRWTMEELGIDLES